MPAKGVTRSSRAKPAINNSALVVTREIYCQTDDLDQALASDVSKLDTLKKTFDSIAISSRDPNVLLYQQRTSLRLIEKLSSENRKARQENEKIVTFMGEIFRLVRAMRSEYDSTFVNVQDDFKSMRFDWGRYMTEVAEHFLKQKKSIEDEKKRFKNAMKKKDLLIEDLQSRLNSAAEQIKATVQALEAQQRRVTIAQRDVYAANEEVKDVNRKLNDQLYLAAHQKCRSCHANEKVREMLSNEIAEKTSIIDSMRDKCVEMDGMLQQQKRVNEILSRSVDKHAFSEKGIRGEFDRIKTENESLIAQIKTLKAAKKVDVAAAAVVNVVATSTTITQNASITPPDSSSSDKSAKDEAGNDSQHGSLQSTPNAAGASNSPQNQLPDKAKPPSAVKTPLINRSPHPSANCASPSPLPPNNPPQSTSSAVDVNNDNKTPAGMVPPKKKLKKKQQLSNKIIRSNNNTMPVGRSRQEHQDELEDGELNETNRQPSPVFKMAQKRLVESGPPNMVLAKKKKSLAIKQKLAHQKRNQMEGQEGQMIFRPKNALSNNMSNKFGEPRECRFPEPKDTRFINDYEWDDRSVVAEEQRQRDARMKAMKELHTRELRRTSIERELAPQILPWQKQHHQQQQDRQMPPFRDQRGRNMSPQDLDFSSPVERGNNLCPAPPIAPELAPPHQMRAFQRCDGATLEDVIRKDNLMGRRGRMEGPHHQPPRMEGPHHQSPRMENQHHQRQQRISPPPTQRFEPPSMENRVPRTSSGLHYARSFEEPQLPDIRSQMGMFPSNSRAQIPPPPTFMRPPPEPPIQRDSRMMNNTNPTVTLQWGNNNNNVGTPPPQGTGWGGILGPYLQQNGPPRQQQPPPPQQLHNNSSWLPNGQNFWRH